MFDLIISGENCSQILSKIEHPNIWCKDDAIRVNQIEEKEALQLSKLAQDLHLDANLVRASLSIKDFKVLAFDMDSTLIQLECIDDIASQIGVGEEVSKITALAMQGHVEFADVLRQRSKILKGVTRDHINRTIQHAILMPGAQTLVRFAREHGLRTYIISGGFSDIAKDVCQRLGMDNYICNELIFDNEKATGEVRGPAGGEILDAQGKRTTLEILCMLEKTNLEHSIAVGDGANELKMLQAAYLGVAFRAKPIVRQSASYHIDFGDLGNITDFFIESWNQAKKF